MIDALMRAIKEKGAPVVVGLDPTPAQLPPHLMQQAFRELGQTPEGMAQAYWEFNRAIIDAVSGLVPAVKPQSAMYEQLGLPGQAVWKKTIDYARQKGLIVIGDVKRGDIGSTSAAYAAAHLGRMQIGQTGFAAFDEDFATVNPYLGSDGIRPFLDVCRELNKGIFVLVKTSNPSSGEFQDVRTEGGRTLYELVGEKVSEWGSEVMGERYSRVGAVVGATYPAEGAKLRALMPHTLILVPGYGAQGGTAADLLPFFHEDGTGAIVNSSRGITAAWKQEKYAALGEEQFALASRAAAEDMIRDIAGALEGRNG